MDSGPTLVNCANIFYQYMVSPSGDHACNCAFTKDSIQVTPKIKIYFSEYRENAQCTNNQKSYIKAYNLSEYPIEIKLRIYMPSYAYYNPTSFTVNRFKICCVCLADCLNLGVIMPCACATATYFACIKSNYTGSKHLSRVEIYYRICMPGKVCNKWYRTIEDVGII